VIIIVTNNGAGCSENLTMEKEKASVFVVERKKKMDIDIDEIKTELDDLPDLYEEDIIHCPSCGEEWNKNITIERQRIVARIENWEKKVKDYQKNNKKENR